MPKLPFRCLRVLMLGLFLLPMMRLAARADDMADCQIRRPQLGKQAASFNGDPKVRKLIDRALRRADREQAEGDGDECVEALDHAAKLLAGS